MHLYSDALARLRDSGLIYPCFCTRREIAAESAASGAAPHGPDGPLYPGTCRMLSTEERARLLPDTPHALRLDMTTAVALAAPLHWHDDRAGRSEEDTSELQALMRISYAVFSLNKNNTKNYVKITTE